MFRNVYLAQLTRRTATPADVLLMDKVKPALSSSVYQIQVHPFSILNHRNSHIVINNCTY